MNSIFGFFVGIIQTISAMFGLGHPAPAMLSDISAGASVEQNLSPQDVVNQYGTLPHGVDSAGGTSVSKPAATLSFHLVATPSTGHVPLVIRFSTTKGDSPTTYAYSVDFGDGSSGKLLSPSSCEAGGCFDLSVNHTYAAPGVYTASLNLQPLHYNNLGVATYLAPYTAATVKVTVSGSDSGISVPGMTKYTDSNFGFSFSYPSDWHQLSAEKGGTLATPPNLVKEYSLESTDGYHIVRFMVSKLSDMKAYTYCSIYIYDVQSARWKGVKSTEQSKADCTQEPLTSTADFNTTVGGYTRAYSPLKGQVNPAMIYVPLDLENGLIIETINRGGTTDNFPIDSFAQKIIDSFKIHAD